jgi:hypothetical protein
MYALSCVLSVASLAVLRTNATPVVSNHHGRVTGSRVFLLGMHVCLSVASLLLRVGRELLIASLCMFAQIVDRVTFPLIIVHLTLLVHDHSKTDRHTLSSELKKTGR